MEVPQREMEHACCLCICQDCSTTISSGGTDYTQQIAGGVRYPEGICHLAFGSNYSNITSWYGSVHARDGVNYIAALFVLSGDACYHTIVTAST